MVQVSRPKASTTITKVLKIGETHKRMTKAHEMKMIIAGLIAGLIWPLVLKTQSRTSYESHGPVINSAN